MALKFPTETDSGFVLPDAYAKLTGITLKLESDGKWYAVVRLTVYKDREAKLAGKTHVVSTVFDKINFPVDSKSFEELLILLYTKLKELKEFSAAEDC